MAFFLNTGAASKIQIDPPQPITEPAIPGGLGDVATPDIVPQDALGLVLEQGSRGAGRARNRERTRRGQ